MASSIFYSQNLAADQYINWGITSGDSGYGIRDNAGTIEFKDTGGSWAPISSSSSGGGWQRVGTVVSLVTGTDTIGSNLRPTDATYTMGDATHGFLSDYIHTNVDGAGTQGLFLQDGAGPVAVLYPYADGSVELDLGSGGGAFYFGYQDAFYIINSGLDIETVNTDITTLPVRNALLRQVVAGASVLTGDAESAQNINAEVNIGGTSTADEATSASFLVTAQDTAVVQSVFSNYSSISLLNTSHIVAGVTNYASIIKAAGATLDAGYYFYGADLAGMATQPYYLWADSRGVYRIREDNVADGSGNPQAVPALYNPRFTKYTAGLANYERIIEQWVANVATVGTENGGTGTLRDLNLIGSHIQHNGHVGISTTVTTSSLVGKTITFVDGLVTAFA